MLAQRKLFSKKLRPIAKDLRGVLKMKCFKFQPNIIYISLVSFYDLIENSFLRSYLQMVCLQIIIITLIVTVHYLRDEILLLKEELSSTDDT